MSNDVLSDLQLAACWERKADFWHDRLVKSIKDQDALRTRIAELEALNEHLDDESWQRDCAALEAEVERLKAHTWEQERAAIVAWLRSGTRLSPTRYALIYATSVEAGEHWPTEGKL